MQLRHLSGYLNVIRDSHSHHTKRQCVAKSRLIGAWLEKALPFYTGAEEWNGVPNHIKSIPMLGSFKINLKKWFMG
ncbi:unnamed protein product [Coregonus sp. 'balchen']|nr:unnamed protein product [Coregonus sp. 'balchen']